MNFNNNALNQIGTKISAGPVSSVTKQGPLALMYPTGRAAGRADNIVSTAEYQNGWIFTGMNQSDKRYSSMSSARNRMRVTGYRDRLSPVSIQEAVCTVLMPMSSTDVDRDSHNFNANKISKVDRAGGGLMSFMSNAISDMTGSVVDSVTGGMLADNDEQLYQAGRNSYGGANIRTKTFTWEVTPENAKDYQAFTNICTAFRLYSYGNVNKDSATLKKIGSQIKDAGQDAQNKLTDITGQDRQQQSILPSIADQLVNAMTVSNPTVWYIRKYGVSGVADDSMFFGPAQIESIEVDNAPDGEFIGTAISPGMAATRKLTITFREVIALTRDTI